MKKGFTLVELLAVIAILAILVIIALPNVMGMFNTAKQNSFNTEVKEIYKTAQQKWIMNNMSGAASNVIFRRVNGKYQYYDTDNREWKETSDAKLMLDLTGRTQLDFRIEFDSAGKVTSYKASDGTFYYASGNVNDLKVEDIGATGKGFTGKWADTDKLPYCTSSEKCEVDTFLDSSSVNPLAR